MSAEARFTQLKNSRPRMAKTVGDTNSDKGDVRNTANSNLGEVGLGRVLNTVQQPTYLPRK